MVVKVPKKIEIRHMAANTGRLLRNPYCRAYAVSGRGSARAKAPSSSPPVWRSSKSISPNRAIIMAPMVMGKARFGMKKPSFVKRMIESIA